MVINEKENKEKFDEIYLDNIHFIKNSEYVTFIERKDREIWYIIKKIDN